MTFLANELETKQLGLLSELVPRADAIAYLVNPSNPNTATAVRAAGEVLEHVWVSERACSAREMHLDTGIPLDGVCEHLTSECRQRCKSERK